ncbi:MAG: alpha-rhamnosidase [Ferruginibacter sp.]|nr:alpha-rhamnosidase [Ferruginibacter sp.]
MKKSIVFCIILQLSWCLLPAQVTVKNLSVEYLANPVGIDVEEPRLSWTIESKNREFSQSAYQVLVASSPDKLDEGTADIWDSHKVLSANSVLVPFTNHPLHSRQRYYWKVRVWDEKGNAFSYSEGAFWEMGLLKNTDWQAKWISAPLVYDWASFVARRKLLIKEGEKEISPAPQFRRSFNVPKKAVKATLYISGVGYNVPCLNGQGIGDQLLDPAFTRYDKTVLYSTYDVLQTIRSGENVLSVVLGNGWYNMFTKAVWGFDHAPWRNEPALLAQLEITNEDGSTQVIVSDETWKVAPGPIIFNSIRQGESYDAGKETPGWNKPGFNDKQWSPPLEVRGPLGILKAQMIQPVKATDQLVPKTIMQPQPGLYVFDLGKAIAGYARLKISAPAGTEITLRYAERLSKDGRVDQQDIGQHVENHLVQTDKYICKGGGVETWNPSFVYHGFQYIEVSGLPANPGKETITGIVLHTAMEPAGSFECSNQLFNSIQQAALNSYQSNFMGYPTDCPQREKNGWTGDAHLAAEMGLYNFKGQNAYTKWLRDITDEQRPSGEIPAIIPSSGWGYFWGNGPAWDNAMVLIPWYLYQYSGDQRILQQMYPHIKRYVDYLGTKTDNHLMKIGLGDWAPAKTKTPPEVTSTAYYYVDALLLSKMAGLFGNDADKEKYAELANKIKVAFNKQYYHQNGVYDQGSQTALACAIYQGLTGDDLDKTVAALVAAVKNSDDHLDCGILGTKYLLHALSDNGHSDMAYKIVNQRSFPSWGNWIGQGATTLWEQWDGSESHNHIMFGDVSAWFYKNLAGISPDTDLPGFKLIRFQPYFSPDLAWVKAAHQSMYGEIAAGWSRKNNLISYTITIPANTNGNIILPLDKKILVDDIALSKSKYAKKIHKENDNIQFILGSGTYIIKLK